MCGLRLSTFALHGVLNTISTFLSIFCIYLLSIAISRTDLSISILISVSIELSADLQYILVSVFNYFD